jgi:uncharacterized protein (DUF1330 family)
VYLITQSEILDRSGMESYNTEVRAAIKKAGGGDLFTSDRVIAVIGTAPGRVGVSEFSSVEKAQAWLNSDERKALAPQRDKTLKFVQQLIVEGH